MIAIGSDHGAYEMKEEIKRFLRENDLEVFDVGTYTSESCDYPVFAKKAAVAVATGECERGIVLCTTGIGVSITANRVRGIRCALCTDPYSAEMTRRHNNANMLALGAGITGLDMARRIVEVWLNTDFEDGRHQRRVDMIDL